MKMAVWGALGVFAAALFAVGLFGWIARPLMNPAVRQMLSNVLSSSSRS